MQKRNTHALCKQRNSLSEESKMHKRSLFYWAKLYASQLNKGRSYKELCPVITINILGFNLFKDTRCDRKLGSFYEPHVLYNA